MTTTPLFGLSVSRRGQIPAKEPRRGAAGFQVNCKDNFTSPVGSSSVALASGRAPPVLGVWPAGMVPGP